MRKHAAEQRALIRAFLERESTLTLATVSPEGSPRACSLFYLLGDSFQLYWVSAESSEHSQNLARSGHACVTVHRSTERWREICGVQMRGQARVVLDPQLRQQITKAYAARFSLGRVMRMGVARSVLYEFCPQWIRYIDNSKRFGYKFEMMIEEAKEVE